MLLSLHSLSICLSLLCWLLPFSFLCACSHLQRLWSKIISIENPPSTNSMVQSTSSITVPSLVWSLHDVLHVTCQSFIPLLFPPPFFLRPSRLHGSSVHAYGWCKSTAPIPCYQISLDKRRICQSFTFLLTAML